MKGICEAAGEIDMALLPTFVAAMRSATDEADTTDLLVDCRAVTFMGISALHALMDANRYAVERGHRLVIRNLSSSCDRFVRISDWHSELVIESYALNIRGSHSPCVARPR